jgi:hypothetical protein
MRKSSWFILGWALGGLGFIFLHLHAVILSIFVMTLYLIGIQIAVRDGK